MRKRFFKQPARPQGTSPNQPQGGLGGRFGGGTGGSGGSGGLGWLKTTALVGTGLYFLGPMVGDKVLEKAFPFLKEEHRPLASSACCCCSCFMSLSVVLVAVFSFLK
jgi:hypothetical protein